MTIYGTTKRFILGTYTNQSQRCTFSKEGEPLQYAVQDQYGSPIIRKIGNRYTTTHVLYDFTEDEKDELLAMNGTIQTYVMCYDSDYSKDVYCDIYFDQLSMYPKSFIVIRLTDLLVDTNPTISYLNRDPYGYYTFDGSNDNVASKLTSLGGNTKSFSIRYNNQSVAHSGTRYIFYSYTDASNYENSYIDSGGTVHYRKKVGGGTETIVYSSSALAVSNDWQNITINFDHSNATPNNRIKIYFDGVDKTTVYTADDGTPYTAGTDAFEIGGHTTNALNSRINHVLVTSDNLTAGDMTNLAAVNITAIDNQVMWWRCNEADPGSPYTGATIYYSGNGNHGTPTNITAGTFFNPPASPIPAWYIHTNIKPTNVFPKLVYSTTSYTFDSASGKPTVMQMNIENIIDYEGVSGTGKLHRRYTHNNSGEVKQSVSAIITKDNITRSDYETLKTFDRQLVTFYPHSSDTSTYYSAYCSILWLHRDDMINFDYCEITLDIK